MGKQGTFLKLILTFSITIVIVLIIFSKINLQSIIAVLSKANLNFLILALFINFFGMFIKPIQWQSILKSMHYEIPFSKCFQIFFAANCLSSVTPSKSGDLIRSLYLKSEIPISETIGSIFTERLLDLLFLTTFTLIGLIVNPQSYFLWIAIILIILIISSVLFLNSSMLKRKVKDTFKKTKLKGNITKVVGKLTFSLSMLLRDKKIFSRILLYSFIFWFISMIQIAFLFYAVGAAIPFLFLFTNIPIAIFISLLPITISGIGTRDAAIIFLFSGYAEPSKLLSASILFLVYRYWIGALIGLPFMYKLNKKL